MHQRMFNTKAASYPQPDSIENANELAGFSDSTKCGELFKSVRITGMDVVSIGTNKTRVGEVKIIEAARSKRRKNDIHWNCSDKMDFI